MAFLLPILPRLLMVLAIAGALGYGWYRVNTWCNAACVEATERAVAAETLLEDAHKRATALALLWAAELDKVKTKYVDRVVVRTQTFGGIRERVGKIGNGVAIPVDADTSRLLADIASAANDPAATGGDTPAPATVSDAAGSETELREWVQFAADAGEAYREAADKHLACVAAYDALSKESVHMPQDQ